MLASRGRGDVSLTAEGLGLSSAASSLDTCVEPGRPRRSPRPVLACELVLPRGRLFQPRLAFGRPLPLPF